MPLFCRCLTISIHALREEGDLYKIHHNGYYTSISIHALREEGDFFPRQFRKAGKYFNPRPPRGGRLVSLTCPVMLKRFQSTPSARRATICGPTAHTAMTYFNPRPPRGGRRFLLVGRKRHLQISIHALREEGDWKRRSCGPPHPDFNPRPPRGGRPVIRRLPVSAATFQSTPSARRATIARSSEVFFMSISIHALREEGDP